MMIIKSSAFKNGGKLPKKYTCDGENISPPLNIENVSPETKSLALIMEDLDAYFGVYNHWIIWNISPEILEIRENNVPKDAVLGLNSFNETQYRGPCPRIPHTHRYLFTIYALDCVLELKNSSRRKELEESLTNHIIDEGKLMVMYSRKRLVPSFRDIF